MAMDRLQQMRGKWFIDLATQQIDMGFETIAVRWLINPELGRQGIAADNIWRVPHQDLKQLHTLGIESNQLPLPSDLAGIQIECQISHSQNPNQLFLTTFEYCLDP